MARTKDPKQQNQPQIWILLQLILIIPWLLIKIGDIVLFLFKLPFIIIRGTYNLITRSIRRFAQFVASLFRALFFRPKPKQGRGRPAKKRFFLFELIRHIARLVHKAKRAAQNTLRKVKNRVAAVSTSWRRFQTGIWKIRTSLFHHRAPAAKPEPPVETVKAPVARQLPIFSFPKLSFPKLSFPKITIPAIRIRRAYRQKTVREVVIYPAPIPTRTKLDQFKSFVAGAMATIVFIMMPYLAYQWLKELPNPTLLSHRDLEVTTKIFDRNGALLYEIYADQNRTPLPLDEIPDTIKRATIAIEDRDFYTHPGFSVRGILRAVSEITLRHQVQGGSTITQQLIKSALLTPEVSITRKVKEIILAFWAERLYTKNQILEMYLNQVPYGGTSWGVEAASQTYFGKSVKNLNLAESALLAGLPQAPTQYSPFGNHPSKAFDRQHEVLRRMREDGYITKKQGADALSTPVTFSQPGVAIRAPHFVMYVKELLEKRYGPRLVERGGLRITTSLDISVQQKVEEILRGQVDALASLNVGNGAAVVTNPKTGEIIAMVGSRNYFDLARQGNVNVTTSLRQPGSSIKVVNYAAALENGFTAASLIDDSPIVYKTAGSQPYAPVNYDGRFHGMTPLRYALANSYNIPAVKTLAKIGVHTMITKGRMMGITTWEDESRFGLSLTLGGGEVTMLDMARVFGTLADGGISRNLMPILDVTDYTGHVFEHNQPDKGMAAVKPEVAWIVSNILADNTARISAFGPNSSLVVKDHTVSVKTGTTDNKRDNWTIGYTPSFLAAVWVGNNDNTPMNPYLTSGVTGAAPIWHDIMTELLKDKNDETVPMPDSVVSLPCYFGRPEYFIRGTEPTTGRCASIPTPTPSGSPTPAQ